MYLFENNQPSFDNQLVLAVLSTKINLNPARLDQILNIYPTLENAVEDNFTALKKNKVKWLEKWASINLQAEITKFQAKLEQNKIEIVTCLSPDYPETLRVLEDFPVVLYKSL